MDKKQLFTSSTPEERLQAILLMLETIEARERQIVFTGQRFIRNRRRQVNQRFHLLGEVRGRHTVARAASIMAIFAALFAVSAATVLISLHAPMHIAPQLLFFPATSVLAVLAFKPRRLKLKPS